MFQRLSVGGRLSLWRLAFALIEHQEEYEKDFFKGGGSFSLVTSWVFRRSCPAISSRPTLY